jgi:glycyl-tRNA synthetase beta chain
MGLSRDHLDDGYDPSALAQPAEQALHAAFVDASTRARAHMGRLDYAATLASMAELKAPVDRLFEEVMVMDEDLEVRRHRLGLLRSVADLFRSVADFTRLGAEG